MLVIIIYQSGKNLIKSVVNYAVMIFPSTLRGTGIMLRVLKMY